MAASNGDDARLANRDKGPLPEGAWLRFQSISRAPDPRSNHRWILYDDGRIYIVFHSDDSEGPAPFDRPLPGTPTRVLSSADMQELRALLDQHRFFDLAPRLTGQTEGGMWQVVTARIGGRVHEVIFDGMKHPISERLQGVGSSS